MSVGSRIGERLEALGGLPAGKSQAWLAREVGVTQPTINALINDPSRGSKHLPAIARTLKTSIAYLTGETDNPAEGAILLPSVDEIAAQLGMQMIPSIANAYALGGGAVFGDYIETTMVPFRRDWLARILRGRPADVFLTHGDGDSMVPTIMDGDDVLVNRAENAIRDQDKIWAVAYGELGTIKRVRRLPDGRWQLNSDNHLVTPIELAEDEMHVVGRVIWIGRRVS